MSWACLIGRESEREGGKGRRGGRGRRGRGRKGRGRRGKGEERQGGGEEGEERDTQLCLLDRKLVVGQEGGWWRKERILN